MSIDKILNLTSCVVCRDDNLISVIDMPNFPITGVFVTESEPGPARGYDQALNICRRCGHGQLAFVIPPPQLYGTDYPHRSSASHLTPTSFAFILNYLDRLKPNHRFRHVLEIGCNDLMLLNKLGSRADRLTGIDPIWRGREDEAPLSPNMTVLGNFVEDVDLATALREPPDLVISTHNLEHIAHPTEQLRRLVAAAAPDALFVIEVPDIAAMARNLRFDQVFHQHVHYFGLGAFLRMVEAVGARYVDHTLNPRNWGGTFVFAFSKDGRAAPRFPDVTADEIQAQTSLFKERMNGLMRMLNGLEGPIWGYGAAQMLPTLAYHLGSDLSFLQGVLDDCRFRPGLTYPHLPIPIRRPEEVDNISDSTVMITALDAVRPIMNRLRDFNPRYVVVPTQVF